MATRTRKKNPKKSKTLEKLSLSVEEQGKTAPEENVISEPGEEATALETPDIEKESRTPVSIEVGEESDEAKLADLNEKYLRLLAEYDNFRKRTAREMIMIIQTATEKLMIELLPILDNLDRATEHKNDRTTFEEYVNGIALIEEQLRAVLARAGLEPIEVIGKPFDPDLHDAMMQIESDEYDSGIITAEAEKGYMLSGKVIRHSKVIVSK